MLSFFHPSFWIYSTSLQFALLGRFPFDFAALALPAKAVLNSVPTADACVDDQALAFPAFEVIDAHVIVPHDIDYIRNLHSYSRLPLDYVELHGARTGKVEGMEDGVFQARD